jgi:peptide deformylase
MLIVDADQIPEVNQVTDAPMDEPIKILQVCQKLEILCEKENGIGISAVQVGIPWKLFLVKGDGTCPLIPKNKYGYFVNCTYQATDEERVVSLEGCLSIRSLDGRLRFFQIERYRNIIMQGYMIHIDKKIDYKIIDVQIGTNEQGVIFQHEIDHQKGVLISDIGKEVFVWNVI